MSDPKTYIRRHQDTIKARMLERDDVVYDWWGEPIPHHLGDMFIETDRLVMSPELFYQIYMEVPDGNSVNEDLPQTLSSDLRER